MSRSTFKIRPLHIFFICFSLALIVMGSVPWGKVIQQQLAKYPNIIEVADVKMHEGNIVLSGIFLKKSGMFFKEAAIDIHWIKLFALTAAADVDLKEDNGSAHLYTSYNLLTKDIFHKGEFKNYPINVNDFPNSSIIKKALKSGQLRISGTQEAHTKQQLNKDSHINIDFIINSLYIQPRALGMPLNIAQGYIKSTLEKGLGKFVMRGTGAQSVALNVQLESQLDFAKLPQSPLKGDGFVRLPLLNAPIQFKLGGSIAKPVPVR